MKRTMALTVGCCGLLIGGGAAWAGDFEMKAGQWESTSTVTMPMMAEPTTMTNVHCVTEEDAKKDPLAMMLAEGRCQPVRVDEGKNRVEFEVTCQGEGGATMNGTGYFEAKGDRASGSIEMKMAMPQMGEGGPREMTVQQEWQARRVGPCD